MTIRKLALFFIVPLLLFISLLLPLWIQAQAVNNVTGLTFIAAFTGFDGLNDPIAITASPDNKHIYVASLSSSSSIIVLSRDSSTGELTFVQRLQDGVGGVDGIRGATSVDVSPDGNHVYAAGLTDNAVAVFSRNADTGELTFVQALFDDGAGGDRLRTPTDIIVSPDNNHVYATSLDNSAITVFSRNTSTGQLTFVQNLRDNIGGVNGLQGAFSVVVSPDNSHVYVAGVNEDALAVFSRNASNGRLTFVQAVINGSGGVSGLNNPRTVTISPDGNHIYAASSVSSSVAVFSRSSSSGQLTFVEALVNNQNGVDGLAGASAVTVSPDNANVYVGSTASAVAVLKRDSSTGQLTFVEALRNGVDGVDGLTDTRSIVITPDNLHVYTAARIDRAVAAFSIDRPEIALSGNGVEIANGDTTPSAADHTDFGTLPLGGSLSRTFTISNTGTGELALNGSPAVTLTTGAHFTITQQPISPVAAGDSTTFEITFSSAAAGVFRETVTIAHNDEDKQPTTFVISAAAENPEANGRLAFVEELTGFDGLDNANSVAVSPDDRYVYAVGRNDNAISVFSRDTHSGALSFVQSLQDGVDGVDGLDGASDVTISPDNQHLYVASSGDNAIAVFSRDTHSGTLTFVEVQRDGIAGVTGLIGATSVTVSPDNQYVYVASFSAAAVAVFSRNTTSGALTFIEALFDNTAGIEGLLFPLDVTISPDNQHLYVASREDAVVVFSRDDTTGALTFVEAIVDDENGVDGLTLANSVAVSPDNQHVYVTGGGDDGLAVFKRDTTSGGLTFVEVILDDVDGVDGLRDASSVEVSPDGRIVYVAGPVDDAIAVFSRDTNSGALTFVQIVRDGVAGAAGLARANFLTISPDNRHLYVTSSAENSLAVFAILHPEMTVSGSGQEIASGDTTPSLNDHTDFGTLPANSSLTRTFTLSNSGPAELTLGSWPPVTLADGSYFSVTQQPGSLVAAGGSTTFEITFTPSALGTFSDTVTLSSDDPDDPTFTFAISGTAEEPHFKVFLPLVVNDAP